MTQISLAGTAGLSGCAAIQIIMAAAHGRPPYFYFFPISLMASKRVEYLLKYYDLRVSYDQSLARAALS